MRRSQRWQLVLHVLSRHGRRWPSKLLLRMLLWVLRVLLRRQRRWLAISRILLVWVHVRSVGLLSVGVLATTSSIDRRMYAVGRILRLSRRVLHRRGDLLMLHGRRCARGAVPAWT